MTIPPYLYVLRPGDAPVLYSLFSSHIRLRAAVAPDCPRSRIQSLQQNFFRYSLTFPIILQALAKRNFGRPFPGDAT